MNRLSIREKTGYALGDAASNLFFQTFMAFLLFFYTDVFGISATAAGTMFLFTKLWNTVNDPVMGLLADRTHSRWGRFRPYLLWMAVPFGLFGVLTFSTPDLGTTGKIVYAYVTYTGMMMAYTAINTPYSALMGVMSPDSRERTSLSSFRFVGAFAGGLLVKSLTIHMVEFFGRGDPARGYQLTMAVFALAAVLMFLITFATTRERVQPLQQERTPLRQDLRDLVHNRPWVTMFLVGLSVLFYIAIRGAVVMYYFTYYVGNQKLAAAFMFAGSIAALVGVIGVERAARRFDKRTLYLVLMATAAVLTLAFYLAGPRDLILIFGLEMLISLTMGATSPLVWAMYADTADYSEWRTGRRATGLVFSAATFSQKAGITLGSAVSGWLLAYFGYRANVMQSAEALRGIRLMMSVIPAAGALLSALFVLRYEIDQPLIQQIERELAARRVTGVAATAPA